MLWSTLELGHHTTRRNMDNYIDSRIERAHSYPLSLVIKKQPEGYFLDPHTVDSLLTLIAKRRLKSITLDYSALEDEDTGILSILKRIEFPNLEILESYSLTTEVHSQLSLPNPLQFAPMLKTLSLKIHHRVSFDMLPFPWRQLTSMTIVLFFHHSMGVLDILQACVKLEEFIVRSDGDHEIVQ